MICFYHKSDLVGICSAAIVLLAYPGAKTIGVDYSNKLEEFKHLIPENEPVYVVDFSFPETDMQWLSDHTKLHWIDHHKTSVAWANEKGFLASGGQSLITNDDPKKTLAGCEQTWLYLFDTPVPKAVYYLGRYDVWDHSDDSNILAFQYGMRLGVTTRHPYWGLLLSDKDQKGTSSLIQRRIEAGKTLLAYETIQNEITAKSMAFETTLNGYQAIAINKAFTNSKIFDSVYDPTKHDIMILFGVKPGQVKYTIYSSKSSVDASQIAKSYGGGGHKGAAGFYHERMFLTKGG